MPAAARLGALDPPARDVGGEMRMPLMAPKTRGLKEHINLQKPMVSGIPRVPRI